jgi:hypothetical protein
MLAEQVLVMKNLKSGIGCLKALVKHRLHSVQSLGKEHRLDQHLIAMHQSA